MSEAGAQTGRVAGSIECGAHPLDLRQQCDLGAT